MKRKVNYQAPFDIQGNLMHYPQIQLVKPKDAVWTDKGWSLPYDRVQPDWCEVVPFEATLTLTPEVTSGRSAKYLHWVDDEGHRFPMFVTDLVGVVLSNARIEKGRVSGSWVVCKRGANYGIRYYEEEK